MGLQGIMRWAVPGIPFALSLCLSLATVGRNPYWQDSGYYLTAIKELGVLYPPGFALYELLCFLWTKLVFFLEFTLAVHLFSSVCAALAAGTVATASRDLLRSRGRIFRVTDEDPGDLADLCGVLAGVFLACGFTFWSAAIYAKGYSFYYLILALLIWRMIRADETGRRRDFAFVAALIGLAWQAHPSAALTGLALLLFVGRHAAALGWKGLTGGTVLAAVCALGPTLVLLPWFASRDSWMMMGLPETPIDACRYVWGRRFLTIPGVFGFEPVRAASFGLYFWEEFLGVGLLLVTTGIATLALARRPTLWGILAWTVPYAVVTILFKIEGQHDCWFIGAWMPLYPTLAVGAFRVARWARDRGRLALAAAGIAGAAWGCWANFSQVSQRQYVMAELYGRTILENVDPNAILLVHGDDAIGLTGYLQRVRGVRSDVLLVMANYLANDAAGHWYDEVLLRRHPFLRPPQYGPMMARSSKATKRQAAMAAFLNANAECGRPMFTEQFVPLELLRPEFTLIPAGAVWKFVPQGTEMDIKYWRFPIEPERIDVRARRARGVKLSGQTEELSVLPQRYEERLVTLIAMARLHLAMGLAEKGNFVPAANLCDSILALGAEYREMPQVVHIAAISFHAAGDDGRAEALLRRSVEIGTIPRNRASACFYLGEIALKRGKDAEAKEWFARSLAVPHLDPATRREIESRLLPK